MRKWWKQSLYHLLFTCGRYKHTCPGQRVWSVGDIVHSSCEVRPQFVSHWHSAWIFCNGIYHHYFYLHITVMLIKRAVGIMSTVMYSIQKNPSAISLILQSLFSCKITVGCVWMYNGNTRFPTLCVSRTYNVTFSDFADIIVYSVQCHQATSGRDKGSSGSSTVHDNIIKIRECDIMSCLHTMWESRYYHYTFIHSQQLFCMKEVIVGSMILQKCSFGCCTVDRHVC